MQALLSFFIWLFGWAPAQSAELAHPIQQQALPVQRIHQPGPSLDNVTVDSHRQTNSQAVTIIIYDDTHFGLKN